MDIKTLDELQQPDDGVLHFSPLGLGAKLLPEDAAVYQQQIIGRIELMDAVPDGVRRSYERVRTVHSYGALCYNFFTVAYDQAQLVIEYALRDRGERNRFHEPLLVRRVLDGLINETNPHHRRRRKPQVVSRNRVCTPWASVVRRTLGAGTTLLVQVRLSRN